jgi:hypothetical protein
MDKIKFTLGKIFVFPDYFFATNCTTYVYSGICNTAIAYVLLVVVFGQISDVTLSVTK